MHVRVQILEAISGVGKNKKLYSKCLCNISFSGHEISIGPITLMSGFACRTSGNFETEL